MATQRKTSTETPADAEEDTAPAGAEHDRVVMVSLRADGTPDQVNHELIGTQD